jgi:hypothetical protein
MLSLGIYAPKSKTSFVLFHLVLHATISKNVAQHSTWGSYFCQGQAVTCTKEYYGVSHYHTALTLVL